MEQKDTLYNKVLDVLKTLPELEKADDLQKSIIQKIEYLPKIKKTNKIITVIGTVSGIAASFLIGLFVYDNINYPQVTEQAAYKKTIRNCKVEKQDLYSFIKNREEIKDNKTKIYSSIISKKQYNENK